MNRLNNIDAEREGWKVGIKESQLELLYKTVQ